jgi:thymidine phosphorylase
MYVYYQATNNRHGNVVSLTVLAKSQTPCFLTSTTGISNLQLFATMRLSDSEQQINHEKGMNMDPHLGGAVGHRSSAVTAPVKTIITQTIPHISLRFSTYWID